MAVLAVLIWHWRTEITHVIASVRPGWMIGALVAGVGVAAIQGACFAELMRKNGADAPRLPLVGAFLLSQPGKYVPGKLASPLMQQLYLGARVGISVTVAANIELALLLVVQIAGLGATLALARQPAAGAAVLFATLVTATAVLRVPAALRLRDAVLRRSPRQATSDVCRPPSWQRAAVLASASVATVVLASTLVIRASSAWDPDSLAASLASLFLGFASSVLAFVVPAGLGVREVATATIGGLLDNAPPTSQLIALAVLFRCWQIVVDALSAAAGILIVQRSSEA